MNGSFFNYKWIANLLLAIAIIAAYKTFDNLGVAAGYIGFFLGLLKPFALGVFIAYLLYGPSKGLEDLLAGRKSKILKKIARPAAVLTVFVVAIVLLSLLISIVVPNIVSNVTDFAKNIPGYGKQVEEFIRGLRLDPALESYINVENIMNELSFEKIFGPNGLAQIGSYTLDILAAGIVNISSGLLTLFMGIVISVYMLISRDSMIVSGRRFLRLLLSERIVKIVVDYAKRINQIFYSFIYGTLLDAVILGSLATIALTLIGAPYSPLFGLFLAFANLVPYFGPIIGVTIVVVLIMLQKGLISGLIALAVLLVLSQVDAQIIGPRVVGQSVGLKPLWIIFAIAVGGGMFGFLGIVLSVPVFAAIRMLLIDLFDFIEKWRQERALAKENGKSNK